MKKPRPPKGGGTYKSQLKYKAKLEEYEKFLKLKEANSLKRAKL